MTRAGEDGIRCPEIDVLARFASGQLDDTQIESIFSHLEHCNLCTAALERIHSAHQPAKVLERSVTLDDYGNEPEFKQMERLVRGHVCQMPATRTGTKTGTGLDDNLEFTVDSAPLNTPSPGERIEGYEVVEEIGQGGFAHVYAVRRERDQHLMAMKIFRRAESETETDFTEFETLQSLDHPSIIKALDWGSWKRRRFFVMPYCDGGNARAAIRESRFDQDRCLEMIVHLARALHHAHLRGFVHRDVKPDNVLLDQSGNIFIADFGLAIHDDRQWSYRGQRAGTRPYMSPEQIRGESHRLDGRTDVWAVGVLLYEMLTGRLPFRGESKTQIADEVLHREPKPLRQIDDTITKDVERICLKCLSKRMADRYQTALDLSEELAAEIDRHKNTLRNDADTKSLNQRTPVIPRGLCSFFQEDSSFYLNLLQGPRDRDGIPVCLSYWLERINGERQSFLVGVIYGQSGCGKSSLVQAGLIPRLGDDVVPLFVESSIGQTTQSLHNELLRAFPELAPENSLCKSLKSLRNSSTKKTLIILDQFEQHLSGRDGSKSDQLSDALRQCDGVSLQCLLIVRDDFWMAISEFIRELEVDLSEQHNVTAIPLFSKEHAETVLTEFGRAYERIPDGPLDSRQRAFIAESVDLLCVNDKVACLRIALLAQLIKDRPWQIATLRKFGGMEGLGVKFLDESIGAGAATEHKHLCNSAKIVLETLLPNQVSDLKGATKTREELIASLPDERDSKQFEELIKLLDSELRLIRTVDTNRDDSSMDHDVRYQLTHDYIVPAVRRWISLTSEATVRGRARLRLQQRTHNWTLSREKRQLPSLFETGLILCFSRWHDWTANQRSMIQHATRMHVGRFVIITVPFMILISVIMGWLMVHGAVTRYLETDATGVPDAIQRIGQYDPFVLPILRQRSRDEALPPEKRLKAILALANLEGERSEELLDLITTDSSEFRRSVHQSLLLDESAPSRLVNWFDSLPAESELDHQKRAIAAVLALNLQESGPAIQITASRSDPAPRTSLINQLPNWAVDFDVFQKVANNDAHPVLAYSVCVGLGNIDPETIRPQSVRFKITHGFKDLFSNASSATTRSAAEYALRKWGEDLPAILPSRAQSRGNWINTQLGIRMIRLDPKSDPDADRDSEIPSQAFYLCDREVTVGMFQNFLSATGQPDWRSEDDRYVSPSQQHPANSVSMHDTLPFLNWLSICEGLDPIYIQTGDTWTIKDPEGLGYRLPTEQEWEYACRAGSDTEFSFGNDPKHLHDYATFGQSMSASHVASKIPNPWGFFDMAGNVWELCQPSRDQYCATNDGDDVGYIRGGGYDNPAQNLRTDERYPLKVNDRLNGIGLRIARSVKSNQ